VARPIQTVPHAKTKPAACITCSALMLDLLDRRMKAIDWIHCIIRSNRGMPQIHGLPIGQPKLLRKGAPGLGSGRRDHA
jgi:hypothetical protein